MLPCEARAYDDDIDYFAISLTCQFKITTGAADAAAASCGMLHLS